MAYSEVIYYNCGEPGHHLDKCVKPKSCFICKMVTHKVENCPVRRKTHSSARYVGSDRNTAYFHAVANQRRRKTLIHSLDGPNGPVTEVDEMMKVASDFYKDLFKKENPSSSLYKTIFSLLLKKSLLPN